MQRHWLFEMNQDWVDMFSERSAGCPVGAHELAITWGFRKTAREQAERWITSESNNWKRFQIELDHLFSERLGRHIWFGRSAAKRNAFHVVTFERSSTGHAHLHMLVRTPTSVSGQELYERFKESKRDMKMNVLNWEGRLQIAETPSRWLGYMNKSDGVYYPGNPTPGRTLLVSHQVPRQNCNTLVVGNNSSAATCAIPCAPP